MKKKKVKRIFAAAIAFIMAFGIIIPSGLKEEVSAATEVAITDIPWDEVEKTIKQKVGQGYNEVGLCTGFVYWCLKNGVVNRKMVHPISGKMAHGPLC